MDDDKEVMGFLKVLINYVWRTPVQKHIVLAPRVLSLKEQSNEKNNLTETSMESAETLTNTQNVNSLIPTE